MPHFDLSSGEHYQAEASVLTPAARRHTETDDAEEAYILRSKLTPGKPNKQGVTTEWLRPAFALQIGAWIRKGTCSKSRISTGPIFYWEGASGPLVVKPVASPLPNQFEAMVRWETVP